MSEIEILVYNYTGKRLPFSQKKIKKIVKKVIIEHLKKREKIALSLIFISSINLNRMRYFWRKEKKAGSVLSFSYHSMLPLLEEKRELGDIFFSLENIKKEAKNFKRSFKEHFLFLLIHSLLHLYGYNHKTKKDAKIMEEKEKIIYKRIKNIL